MATVPIVTGTAACSRVSAGPDFSWDGLPLVVGKRAEILSMRTHPA